MVLVAYASRHGATRGVAEAIAARLRGLGHEVAVRPAEEVREVESYEAVVVGSAVYYKRWLKPAAELLRRHAAALARRPVWLFSSGPLADQPADEPVGLTTVRDAIHPRGERIFHGSLDVARLNLLERMVVGMVKAQGGDYRRWDEIHAWAEDIASQLKGRAVGGRQALSWTVVAGEDAGADAGTDPVALRLPAAEPE